MAPHVVATFCGHDRDRCLRAREQYLAALRRAGFEVTAIDPGAAAPAGFDALCLTGGGDIDPARYGEPDAGSEDIDPRRDATELGILAAALARDVPILGICRGFQLINVAFGGGLVQHVDGHSPSAGPLHEHRALALTGSRLAAASGSGAHAVNSSHHQAVTAELLAPALCATVWIDGLVEAFESPEHRWLVAVQWHPERTSEVSPEATHIFRAFADAASLRPAAAR